MPAKAKTFLIWLVVIFLIYAVVKSPDRSAEIVGTIGQILLNAFKSIGQFFGNLLG